MNCEGQMIPISEYEVLFNLIGTTYGGDGQETFQLPNLGGRVPLHQGTGPGLSARILGEVGGVASVTLTGNQLGGHTHGLMGSTDPGASPNTGGAVLATGSTIQMFRQSSPSARMAANAVSSVGGSQPHENSQPYLPIRFIISMFGIFPTQG
jgi:microcystin-dependent protein